MKLVMVEKWPWRTQSPALSRSTTPSRSMMSALAVAMLTRVPSKPVAAGL